MNKQKEANNLGLLFIIIVAVNLLISFLGNVLVNKMNINIPWWSLTILSEAGILLPSILYVKIKGQGLGQVIPFKKVKISTVFLVLLLTLVVEPVSTFANLFSQLFVSNVVAGASDTMLSTGIGMVILMPVIVAPLCEELTMRGVFYNRYKDTTPLFKAVLMSAFFFGMMHLNFNQFCYAFALGIFFALANIASGSIWTSIIMHAAVNALGTLMLVLSKAASKLSGQDISNASDTLRTSGLIPIYLVIFFIFAVIGTLLSIPILKAIARREGNTEILESIFRKKEGGARVFFNLPTILSVVLFLAVIFGWDRFLDMIF